MLFLPRSNISEQALHLEFQEAAQDARSVVAAIWQTIYIFLSASVVALGVVIQQLIDVDDHTWTTFYLTLPIAVAGAVLGVGLLAINRRQGWIQEVTYFRIREIEDELGMLKHTYINVLDNWTENKKWHKRSDLSDLRKSRPPLLGRYLIASVIAAVVVGWVALVLVELCLVLA